MLNHWYNFSLHFTSREKKKKKLLAVEGSEKKKRRRRRMCGENSLNIVPHLFN